MPVQTYVLASSILRFGDGTENSVATDVSDCNAFNPHVCGTLKQPQVTGGSIGDWMKLTASTHPFDFRIPVRGTDALSSAWASDGTDIFDSATNFETSADYSGMEITSQSGDAYTGYGSIVVTQRFFSAHMGCTNEESCNDAILELNRTYTLKTHNTSTLVVDFHRASAAMTLLRRTDTI